MYYEVGTYLTDNSMLCKTIENKELPYHISFKVVKRFKRGDKVFYEDSSGLEHPHESCLPVDMSPVGESGLQGVRNWIAAVAIYAADSSCRGALQELSELKQAFPEDVLTVWVDLPVYVKQKLTEMSKPVAR